MTRTRARDTLDSQGPPHRLGKQLMADSGRVVSNHDRP